jgi:hypothetical protein
MDAVGPENLAKAASTTRNRNILHFFRHLPAACGVALSGSPLFPRAAPRLEMAGASTVGEILQRSSLE